MRRFALVGIVATALVGLGWTFVSAQTKAPLPVFQIVVEPSANGLKATCVKGCAWKTLDFGCEVKGQPCKAEIDQFGVGGVK